MRVIVKISSNGNSHLPNIDAISGALFTLRIQYGFTLTQCDEGAKDGIDIWFMGIILLRQDFSIQLLSLFQRHFHIFSLRWQRRPPQSHN